MPELHQTRHLQEWHFVKLYIFPKHLRPKSGCSTIAEKLQKIFWKLISIRQTIAANCAHAGTNQRKQVEKRPRQSRGKRRDEKALVEFGYQEQQNPSTGIAVSPESAPCPQADACSHASAEIKDRLSRAVVNEGFTSTFRISNQGWIASATGRSISVLTVLKTVIEAAGAICQKQMPGHWPHWLYLRYKIGKFLTEFRQFRHKYRVISNTP